MSRSLATCGFARHGCDAEIRRRADGVAYVAGVYTCGSPWACPWCAPAIACARAAELTELVERARDAGLHALMVTLTVRHGPMSCAGSMFRDVAKAWSRLTSGRWWVNLEARWGIRGFVRGVEATYGPNGWHPHIHSIILTAASASACVIDRPMIAFRWRHIVRHVLGPEFEPDDVHGVDIRECDVGAYIAKMGFEVGSGGLYKRAADGYRTPWDIARAAAEHDPESIELWREWQLATYGRKQLTWSQGARMILGRLEKSDEECAAEPESPADEVVIAFAPAEWRVIECAVALMLDAAEVGTVDDVLAVARDAFRAALARGDELAWRLRADPRSRFYGIDTS